MAKNMIRENGETVTSRALELAFLGRVLLLAAMMQLVCGAGASAAQNRDAIARGRYLVERVGVCGDCHTPTIDGKRDRSHWLGGAVFPYKSPPGFATIAPRIAGLPAGWSREQTVRFLETGARPDGTQARPPMPAYRLNPEDASAVTSYLESLRKSH
jgi:mono/diheme cytochrome c family protein